MLHTNASTNTAMLRPHAPAKSSAIHKRRHQQVAHPLVGRRCSVPQRFTEVEDDGDGFCFGAIITRVVDGRALLKFDYTGDVEAYSMRLVREWLCDAGVTCLCDALSNL